MKHAPKSANSSHSGRPGMIRAALGGAFVMLLGGFAAVSLTSAQTDQMPVAAAPETSVYQVMAQLTAPPAPGSFGIANQDTDGFPDVVLASDTLHSSLEALPDCVTQLNHFLSPIFVSFDQGSADINTQNVALLSRISEEIMACEDAYVMVAGHADGSGEDAINLALSWERADRTLNRMLSLGVDPQAIEAIGFGARAPLAQGSDDGDIADRRVDFRVMRKP